MSREKQIEEMAKIMTEKPSCIGLPCSLCEFNGKVPCLERFKARYLYEAGYRKQSENMVEVVRCKDCKHSRSMVFDGYYYCKRHRVVRKADDFCSRGAKMKGGAE